ncbi:MAG TPA: GntR family transcriptional regulator [Gemmatimonadaceae bacterium]
MSTLRPQPRQLPPASNGTRSRLTVHAYSQIRARIIRGELAQNVHLVELDLVRKLGVGRTPVREALQLLESEGLAVSKGGGRLRMFVAPMSAAEQLEIAEMLAILEGYAAARLASFAADARSSVVEELKQIHAAFAHTASMKAPSEERLFEKHRDFHAAIVRNARHSLLLSTHAPVSARMERYEWLYGHRLPGTLRSSIAEHAEILGAIRRGRANEAERAVRANWLNASARLKTVL